MEVLCASLKVATTSQVDDRHIVRNTTARDAVNSRIAVVAPKAARDSASRMAVVGDARSQAVTRVHEISCSVLRMVVASDAPSMVVSNRQWVDLNSAPRTVAESGVSLKDARKVLSRARRFAFAMVAAANVQNLGAIKWPVVVPNTVRPTVELSSAVWKTATKLRLLSFSFAAHMPH